MLDKHIVLSIWISSYCIVSLNMTSFVSILIGMDNWSVTQYEKLKLSKFDKMYLIRK